jgi:acetyl esterase/lipase
MTSNSETLLPDGTAVITRVIPVPDTLSPEAQAHLTTGVTWAPEDGSPGQTEQIERALAMYPVHIEAAMMANVPVKVVRPQHAHMDAQDCVLMNLHGGGFVTDSGSMLESIPIAALTGIPVVTVLYRLAPQHKFPAASPIYADLRGFPPTLCIAGTRDMMLSGTANFHRALVRAGVDADLMVFDAMPHAHWYMVGIPEASEANEAMAHYFLRALGLQA